MDKIESILKKGKDNPTDRLFLEIVTGAEKINSNTQLYKQAGNSICECVLKAIIGKMR